EVAGSSRGQAIDGDGGHSAVLRNLRHAADSELGWNAENISKDRSLKFIRVDHPHMHLICKRRSEGNVVADCKGIGWEAVVSPPALTHSDSRQSRWNCPC